MALKLFEVTKENWLDCASLKLAESQKGFVASNLKTIAESKFEEHYQLRAVVKDETIIGMLAYCPEVDEPVEGLYWLFRLMIDESYQGKGYGKRAIELCLIEMKDLGAVNIRTMCKPTNTAAEKCYLDLGFENIGNLDDGDILFQKGV